MNPDLPVQIERYLFERKGWVSSRELEEVFEVNERAFRCVKDRPGLCTTFAVSSNKGFRHIAHATDEEFRKSMARIRGNALGQLMHVRQQRRTRESILATRATLPPFTFERATGQGVLLTT